MIYVLIPISLYFFVRMKYAEWELRELRSKIKIDDSFGDEEW